MWVATSFVVAFNYFALIASLIITNLIPRCAMTISESIGRTIVYQNREQLKASWLAEVPNVSDYYLQNYNGRSLQDKHNFRQHFLGNIVERLQGLSPQEKAEAKSWLLAKTANDEDKYIPSRLSKVINKICSNNMRSPESKQDKMIPSRLAVTT